MILQGSRINIAAHSLWGEPLDRTIPIVLARDLEKRCNCPASIGKRSRAANQTDAQLSLRIDRFGPTDRGSAILSGEYRLILPEGEERSVPFYLTQDLTEDGYRAAVQQMRALIGELAAKIATDHNRAR